MNAVLNRAIQAKEDVLVVFAHGGEYQERLIRNTSSVRVWYYTPDGKCIWTNELKPIIDDLQRGFAPESGEHAHIGLRCAGSHIDDTSFTFHDASGNVERYVNLKFGVKRLRQGGLSKDPVNLCAMRSMNDILDYARTEGIKDIVQLSCKAKKYLAQLTGPCAGPKCRLGVMNLDPADGPTINILGRVQGTQCDICLKGMVPSTLEVAGLTWGMKLTVGRSKLGVCEERNWDEQPSTGSIDALQKVPLNVSPGDSIRGLTVTVRR